MLKFLKKDRWSPYFAGIMIAILSASSFFLLDKMLGTTTTIVRLAAAVWNVIDPNHLSNNAYYMKYLNNYTRFVLYIN